MKWESKALIGNKTVLEMLTNDIDIVSEKIKLAKAVKGLVEEQAKFPDWNRRDDIKSALKVSLILLLDEYGYPPVERDEVYVEIFEQAENFKKNQVNP
jgi:type I restriction enzyme R subunit